MTSLLSAQKLKIILVILFTWIFIPCSPIRSDENNDNEFNNIQIKSASLNAEELNLLESIETYLNSIKTFRSLFFQASSEGELAEGVFYLRRPGRLRISYFPPTPVLIVGDGTFLHFHDTELGQISDWPIFDTPLGVLSSDNFQFNNQLIVTEFVHHSNVFEICLVKKNDPGIGTLTLYLSDSPIELKQWKIIDAQNISTTVTLLDAEINIKLDNKLFVFDVPRETINRR